MDKSKFKTVKTQRGYTYSYYYAAPSPGKPVLLFAHGFPSGSYLWRKQVPYFEPKGYGIIVPDFLGYGGTDKPTDPTAYVGSGHALDVADILAGEKVDKVIAIGHDWGSRVVSKLVNWKPDVLIATAFLAVGYGAPDSSYADPIARFAQIKEMFGYDVLAYMQYFTQPAAIEGIEKNFDSFFSLVFPSDPSIWKDNMCVQGGAQDWIENGKTTELHPHITAEDKAHYKETLLGGGLSAPLCWYRVLVDKANPDDDAKIPTEAYNLNKPVLWVPFTEDPLALPAFGDYPHSQYVKGALTRKELAGDHWAVVSKSDEVNKILEEWIEGLDV